MSILIAAAIIVGSVVVMCGLLFAVHRLGSKDAFLADTTRGAGVYAVVGTSFAVLLAFVVLVGFESYTDAKDGAQTEADAVVELSRTAQFFHQPQRLRFEGELICYARAVIHKEWPSMKDGNPSPLVDFWAAAQQQSLDRLTVDSAKESDAFSDMLTLRNDRQDGRRKRLTQSSELITAPVWFVLILGALINIGFVLVLIDRRSEGLGAQFVLMASITAIVVAGLLLVWFLDHPFEDSTGSIQPTEMERSLAVVTVQAGPRVPIPCNSDGVPSRT